MKLYYEAAEPSEGSEAEFVRIDVTEYSAAERAEILAALKDLMPGCSYADHECHHEEGSRCTMRSI